MAKNIFVTSDIWINRPIGKLANKTSNEYNEILIENWNKVVKPKDVVYILGGVGISDIYSTIIKLNGTIHILNNFFTKDEIDFTYNLQKSVNCSVDKNIRNKFVFHENQIVTLYDEDVVLSYFPLSDWYGKESGTMCFHGFNSYTDFNEKVMSCCMSDRSKPLNIKECKSNLLEFDKNSL